MPIKQIAVGGSRTINLGNFESLRVEASVIYEYDANDPQETIERGEDIAQVELRKLLTQTYRNMTQKNGKAIGS